MRVYFSSSLKLIPVKRVSLRRDKPGALELAAALLRRELSERDEAATGAGAVERRALSTGVPPVDQGLAVDHRQVEVVERHVKQPGDLKIRGDRPIVLLMMQLALLESL
jgi:hypothetical protein